MQRDGQSVSGDVVDRAGSPDESARAARVSGRFGVIGMVVLCLLAYLPGFFGMPPSSGEGRYAQASRQVFESLSLPTANRDPTRHSAILPRLQDQASVAHGPAGHWLQAASAAGFTGNRPFRDSIWMYRVPSLVAALVVLILTRRLAVEMFDHSAGRLAAVLFAVCPLAMWTARQADAEMMLVAWTMVGISGLWSAWSAEGRASKRAVSAFWCAFAGGMLTGGLAVPLILALTAVFACALSRRWRLLRDIHPLIGLPGALAVVAAWFYVVSGDARPADIAVQMWHAIAWNGGWTPPGVHTVLAPALLWPGSLLLIPGAIVAWKLRTQNPAYLFIIAWTLPAWLLLEAMPGKSLSSTLPLYPALAILGARALLAADAEALPGASASPTRPGNLLWLCIGAALAVGGLGLLAGRVLLWPGSTVSTLVITLFASATALILLRTLRASWKSILKGRFARAAIAGSGVMLLLGIAVPTLALPRWLGLPIAINAELEHLDPSGVHHLVAAGFESDSLLFLSRGRLHHEHPDAAGMWLVQHEPGFLIRERSTHVNGARVEVGAASGFDPVRWNAVKVAIEETPR